MESLFQDIRYGVRMLTKNPAVSAVAVLTLALGIGANAAIFSGVSAFILRPLPVPDPDQLVRPVELAEDRGISDELSYPDFLDYRNQSTVFEAMSAEDMVPVALDSENQSDVVWGQVVSGSYFDVVRVKPIMGRTFLPEEDNALGAHPVMVMGYSLWQRRFGSDPNIVGKTIRLSNRGYQVIGVAPESFTGSKFALTMDFWIPMAMAEELRRSQGLLSDRDSHWMNVLARLKPGVTIEQATAEMKAIAARLNQAYPNDRASNTSAKVSTEVDGRWEEAATVMKSAGAIAMAIVGLVLLIACANVANLMLARAAARRKEIGIRLALGAKRVRLVRQLLTESLLLSVLGGGFGLLLAYWVTDLMEGFVPVLQYNIVDNFFTLDSRALVFTAVISLATGLIFGLAPAWHSSNPDVVPILKGDLAAGERTKGRRFSLRPTLVVVQVALSLAVLVCGGLFIKSFRKAQTMDPGFATKNALIATLDPELVGYDTERSRNFFRQAIERASSLPGVEAAAAARLLPLGDSSNSTGPVLREGETLARGSAGRTIMTNVISSGYFRAMQIPIVDGRDFDDRDHAKAQRVDDRQSTHGGDAVAGRECDRETRADWRRESRSDRSGRRCEDWQVSQPRRRCEAVFLFSDDAAPSGEYESRDAHERRSTPTCRFDPQRSAEHRSQRAGFVDEDDDRTPDLRVVGAEHGCFVVPCLWRAGDAVECGRTLQRDGVRGFAAHARSGDSHGAGR